LDLLEPPIPASRVIHLLERFHGFHAVWEPALAAVVPEHLLQTRRKLPLLANDLKRLGHDEERLRHLPRCSAAAALCADAASAAGSLYVLEGSTLGGRIIGRSLQAAPWYPAGRIEYWDPYGGDTSRRWSETIAYLESLAPAGADAIVRSALATFDLLHAWLLPHREHTGVAS
jgi:heme oxygenase (biliverdin-IX-beta and delta-forming)